MPTYKTHAIHITKCNDYIDKRIDLDLEDLKAFSFGPDSLVFTDPITFNESGKLIERRFVHPAKHS